MIQLCWYYFLRFHHFFKRSLRLRQLFWLLKNLPSNQIYSDLVEIITRLFKSVAFLPIKSMVLLNHLCFVFFKLTISLLYYISLCLAALDRKQATFFLQHFLIALPVLFDLFKRPALKYSLIHFPLR